MLHHSRVRTSGHIDATARGMMSPDVCIAVSPCLLTGSTLECPYATEKRTFNVLRQILPPTEMALAVMVPSIHTVQPFVASKETIWTLPCCGIWPQKHSIVSIFQAVRCLVAAEVRAAAACPQRRSTRYCRLGTPCQRGSTPGRAVLALVDCHSHGGRSIGRGPTRIC